MKLSPITLIANHAIYGVLSTAVVYVKRSSSCSKVCTVLASGSQVNLVTTAAAREVKAQVTLLTESISGLVNSATYILGRCQLLVQGGINNFNVQLTSSVLDHIIKIPKAQIPKRLQLVDPECCTLRQVDMLIGNGIFWTLITDRNHDLTLKGIRLQNTVFGHIFLDPLDSAAFCSINKPRCNMIKCYDLVVLQL